MKGRLHVRRGLIFLAKVFLINVSLIAINAFIARFTGWSRQQFANILFLCGALVLGLGASRFVTRWDRPTNPEAMLAATTQESSLRDILRESRREDRSDLSFFFLMGSAGRLCILMSVFLLR